MPVFILRHDHQPDYLYLLPQWYGFPPGPGSGQKYLHRGGGRPVPDGYAHQRVPQRSRVQLHRRAHRHREERSAEKAPAGAYRIRHPDDRHLPVYGIFKTALRDRRRRVRGDGSRGLGDVYKRQVSVPILPGNLLPVLEIRRFCRISRSHLPVNCFCC